MAREIKDRALLLCIVHTPWEKFLWCLKVLRTQSKQGTLILELAWENRFLSIQKGLSYMPQDLTAIQRKTLTILLSQNFWKYAINCQDQDFFLSRTSKKIKCNLLFYWPVGAGEFQGVMYVFYELSKPLLNRISADIVSGNIIWVNES